MARNWCNSIFVTFFNKIVKMFAETVCKFSPCFSYVDFFGNVQVMQEMRLVEVLVNLSLMLIDGLGPEILVAIWIKGHGLHPERVHFKVPGWLWDFSALLTRKLRMFLSRLKDTIGGSEKVCLVSGSFCRILKFLRMMFFTVTGYVGGM